MSFAVRLKVSAALTNAGQLTNRLDCACLQVDNIIEVIQGVKGDAFRDPRPHAACKELHYKVRSSDSG